MYKNRCYIKISVLHNIIITSIIIYEFRYNILKIHIKNEYTYSFLIYNLSSNVSWEDPVAFHLPKKVQTAYKDTFPLKSVNDAESLFDVGVCHCWKKKKKRATCTMQATVSDRKLQTKCSYRESWDMTHIILMSIEKMLKIHGKEYTNKYSTYLQTKAEKLSCSIGCAAV